MTDATNELQKALYARLAADATLSGMLGESGIFDRRLAGKPMPYLVIAELSSSDAGPGLEEHLVIVEAWSDADNRRQIQTIAGRVRFLLHDAALALETLALVNLQHRTTGIRREPKTRAFVAEMTFRAVTE